MTKVGSMTVDDEPAPERVPQAHDFSSLQGLQVVGDAWPHDDDQPDAGQALALELEARAARFHEAVDASIVLANDGVIRWLGDPIAKLASGADLLTPRAVILADGRLPEGARATVETRVELWLAALTRKLLGPLFSLRDLQDAPDPVRDLAGKVANALGVLERDAVRNQVKAFDQNARAALRKQGVRFGAYYIYVPTVLKPAARALALQLWGLRTSGFDSDALSQTLAPMASSGRTSLPCDQTIARDSYRVAGFRPCGERVVRVDIVERLADMIRAAFIPPNPEHPARSEFIVNGQMTSLTGCSGEAFASILRSLGFESFAIRRSELPAPPASAEAQPSQDASAATAVAEPSEAPEPAAPILAPGDPSAGAPSEAEAPPMNVEAPEAASNDSAAERVPEEPEGSEHAAAEKQGADMAAQDVEPPSTAGLDTPEGAADDTPARADDPAGEEMITLWRPARRARPARVSRSSPPARRTAPHAAAALVVETDPAASPVPQSEQRRAKGRRWERRSADQEKGAQAQPGPGRSEGAPSDEKRRQFPANRAMPRAKLGPASQPAPAVDPNSPFAKLLELRTLLESQGKNRR